MNGDVLDTGELDRIMHCYLVQIQVERSKLIPKDIVGEEEFYLHHSLRRGFTTCARNQGVSEVDINTASRWQNHENAGGRKPGRNMMEHYSQIIHLIPTLLCYCEE